MTIQRETQILVLLSNILSSNSVTPLGLCRIIQPCCPLTSPLSTAPLLSKSHLLTHNTPPQPLNIWPFKFSKSISLSDIFGLANLPLGATLCSLDVMMAWEWEGADCFYWYMTWNYAWNFIDTYRDLMVREMPAWKFWWWPNSVVTTVDVISGRITTN